MIRTKILWYSLDNYEAKWSDNFDKNVPLTIGDLVRKEKFL